MSRRATWEILFERFDPMKPVDNAAWRAERPRSPTPTIEKALDFPHGAPHILLTGTVGTGKTTELLRIAQDRAAKEFVVFLSLERHFQEVVGDPAALQNVSAWEVCFLAGVALLRAAEERLGFQFPRQHLQELERAWRALAKASGEVEAEPEIDIARLSKSMVLLASTAAPGGTPVGAAVAVGLRALEAVADAGRWSLPFGLQKRSLPDQDSQVQTLLACVNVLIGLVQQRAARVLLIIDGLDRIESFERASGLFIDSNMIGLLDSRLIVCGPFILRQDGAINAVRGFSDVAPIVNVPVLDAEDPSRPGPGIAFFRDLFARRTAALGSPLISPELLDRLAYYSGGRAREFIVFVRELAQLAWHADADAATAELVDEVIDDQRRKRETGLHAGHARVLEAVIAEPRRRLPADPLAHKLVTYGAVLPYPDGSEWYYPHPLLMIRFVRAPAGSKKSDPASA